MDSVCGLFAALSVRVKVPVWFSIVDGLKVTVMVHVPFTAILPLQVFVCEKSDGTVPVTAMFVMLSAAAPVFFTVTGCALGVFSGTFANARLVGFSVTAGNAPALPVPVRVTECGLPVALSVTVTLAVRVPTAMGENVTAILQLKPAARGEVQLLVCA